MTDVIELNTKRIIETIKLGDSAANKSVNFGPIELLMNDKPKKVENRRQIFIWRFK